MERKNETKYIFLLLLAICFLASAGIWVRSITLPPISIGFYRMLLTLPLLLPLVYKELPKLKFKDVIVLLLAGFFLGMDLLLWNVSFLHTSIANATLFVNLTFLTIVPVSYFAFKEEIKKSFIAGVLITLLGVIILMSGKINSAENGIYGNFLALLASSFYAGFLLISYKTREKFGPMTIIFIASIGGAVTLFLGMLLKEGMVVPPNSFSLVQLIIYSFVMQLLGQGTMSYCLGKLSASLTSVLVLAQPIIAAFLAFILFHETLNLIEIIGVLITLVGIWQAKRSS
ncbi:MAG: DMT family transporter [Tissierellia bacterium]|nr:DMT family transporter [Tissierellia bacterium]